MYRAQMIVALTVTIATVRVLAQADVTLTCPQDWSENMPVTLFCEVSKSSIATKCAAASQTTFFRRDPGSGYTSLCTVGSADNSSCNFGTPSTTSCGCRQNSTHYTFVYYISSPGKQHDGDWDCDKSCTPTTGVANPLTKYSNPSCTGVTVAAAVSADPAVSLVCPTVFRNGTDNSILYEVDSAAIANAGCLAATTVVFNIVLKGQTVGTPLCSAPYPPTSCVDFTTSDNCGCVQQEGTTDIVYTYKYTFPVDDSHVGGRLEAQLCVGANPPIKMFRSRSCDSVSFGGTDSKTDVTLTCPNEWLEGKKATLYCDVLKSSVERKCTASAPNTTDFNIKKGSDQSSQCTVGEEGYAKCSDGLELNSKGCGCRQNDTHYTFVFTVEVNEEIDGRTWDCMKGCNAQGSLANPLSFSSSPHCKNINVKTRLTDVEKAGIGIGVSVFVIVVIFLCISLVLYYRFGVNICQILCKCKMVTKQKIWTYFCCDDACGRPISS